MKKPTTKFVLAEATLAEVNKQLTLNLLVTIAVVVVLSLNILKFMTEKTVFYAVLSVIMMVFLFFIQKARRILILRKQQLTHQ